MRKLMRYLNQAAAAGFVILVIWQAVACSSRHHDEGDAAAAPSTTAGSNPAVSSALNPPLNPMVPTLTVDYTGPIELFRYNQSFAASHYHPETIAPFPGQILSAYLHGLRLKARICRDDAAYAEANGRNFSMAECYTSLRPELAGTLIGESAIPRFFLTLTLRDPNVDPSIETSGSGSGLAAIPLIYSSASQYASGIFRNAALLQIATAWAKPIFIRTFQGLPDPIKAQIRGVFTHAIEYAEGLRNGELRTEIAYMNRSVETFTFENPHHEEPPLNYRKLEAFIFRRVYFDQVDVNWIVQTLRSTLSEM